MSRLSNRSGIKVAERYDEQDWLKDDAGGWSVAYHDTSRENAVSTKVSTWAMGPVSGKSGINIAIHVVNPFSYGPGVYCTPDPNTTKAHYSTDFTENVRVA